MSKTIDQPLIQREDGKQGLTRRDLNRMMYRWMLTSLSSLSFSKLESHAYAWSMLPLANKFYGSDPEAKRRLLVRHSQFYNTEPQVGLLVNGIIASLEEGIALGDDVSEEVPTAVKTALMGPLAGLGDSLIQGMIVPTLLSIGMGLAAGGNLVGPLFYIATWVPIGLALSYSLFYFGYRKGVGAIDFITGEGSKRLIEAISTIGIIVVGTLAAGNVKLATLLQIPHGEELVPLQSTLDSIFPGLLPLVVTLFAWYLLTKRQVRATSVLIILTAGVIVLSLVGFC